MKKSFYKLGKQVISLTAIIVCALLFSNQAFSQGVSINNTGTGTAPDGSAILDLNITNKGFLVPRMTLVQRNLITSPANSLLIYQTDNTPGFYYNSNTPLIPIWTQLGGGGGLAPTAGNDIDISGVTQVDVEPILNYVHTITPTLPATNDLTLMGPAFKDLILGAGGAERARFLSTGNFGIGDATPASLFTVGSGDLFQVNSAGAIAAATGVTSSGTITFSGLGGSGVQYVKVDNAGVLSGQTGIPVADLPTLAGDVTGAINANTIADNAVDGSDISITGESATNTALQYNNGTGNWEAVNPASTYVTSFSAINTGLTPNAATTGAITLAGTLDVDNGGTGATTLTGMLLGNGTSPVTGVTGTQWGATYWSTANTIASTAQGTSGNLLMSNGAGAPTWSNNIPAGDGDYIQNQNASAQATSKFWISNDAKVDGSLILKGSAANYTTITSAATGNYTLTLPVDDGTLDQVLATNGSGTLSWATTFTNPMTNTGDIIYGGTNATPSTPTRLAFGTGILHGNGNAAPTWAAVNMAGGATEVSGILPVGNGGTGVATIATNGMVLGAGTGPVTTLVGTNMQTIRNIAGVWNANNNILDNGTVVGMGGLTTAEVTASTAKLDIDGDNAGTLSLRLRSGNTNAGTSSSQIAFGYNGSTNFEHLIKTRHESGNAVSNAIEFWLSLTGGAAVRTAFFDGQGGLSLNSETTTFSTRIVPTAGQTANYLIKLPNTISAAGQGLVATDANGTLAWTTVGSGTVTSITPGVGINVGSAPITTTGTIDIIAGNGLTADAGEDKIELGGTLDEITTINQSTFAFTLGGGTGAVSINDNSTTAATTIGTGTTSGNVQVGGASNYIGIGGAANASYKLTITGKVKSTGINETSDARLKMNFATIDGALNKVLSMNGKYYNWRTQEFPDKGLEEGRQVGVIAQEIEKILPEVVTTGDDGYKAVEYSHIVPVLIEAIKEQQKIIEGQKSTITELKASLENVLNRVSIIEKNVDLNGSKVEK